MKVSEFEAKLGTVSDAKLRQMLAASREHGPEVAVELILAEGRKRGLEDWDTPSARERSAQWPEAEAGDPEARMAVATSAYSKEGAGAFGSDAPEMPPLSEPGPGAAPDRSDGSAPALAPEWLAEETKSGLPLPVKILLFAAVVGGLLAAWKFYH